MSLCIRDMLMESGAGEVVLTHAPAIRSPELRRSLANPKIAVGFVFQADTGVATSPAAKGAGQDLSRRAGGCLSG